jgi:hypothetical protein
MPSVWAPLCQFIGAPHRGVSAVNKIVFSSQSGVAFQSRHAARKGENAAADDESAALADPLKVAGHNEQ